MFIIISKYFLRIFIFFKQLLITYLFLSSLLFYAAPSPEIQIISNSESTNIENEAVDLLISYRFGDKQNSQRLFGTFSNAGSNYETAGDIIQVCYLFFYKRILCYWEISCFHLMLFKDVFTFSKLFWSLKGDWIYFYFFRFFRSIRS